MDLELRDAVAVVTGANKGIGLAITKALVAEGAYVVAGSLSTENLDEIERVTPTAVSRHTHRQGKAGQTPSGRASPANRHERDHGISDPAAGLFAAALQETQRNSGRTMLVGEPEHDSRAIRSQVPASTSVVPVHAYAGGIARGRFRREHADAAAEQYCRRLQPVSPTESS
jgi:NAD(P)-dependent dehydrogenase (short-subunit alcohol dehydrogenase family)